MPARPAHSTAGSGSELASHRTQLTPGSAGSWSGGLVQVPVTGYPREAKSATTALPTNPDPPVTKTFSRIPKVSAINPGFRALQKWESPHERSAVLDYRRRRVD